MKSKIFEWLAIVLILETGLLHYLAADGWFLEAAYMGYLFMANFLAALLAAYGIYRKQGWGWALGLLVAVGSIAGYVWSRTIGLPGTVVEDWFSPVGLVALTVEALFVVLMIFRPWRFSAGAGDQPVRGPAFLRDALPASGLLVIALIGFSASQWSSAAAATVNSDGHIHVSSLGELCRTPLTSLVVLEQQYGIQIAQVAITAMDSIVDVRIKVIDPVKAASLFNSHSALLVNQQALILAPQMHRHDALKPGGMYIIFFPTERNTVHTGSEVSLVFGSLRVEPVTVK